LKKLQAQKIINLNVQYKNKVAEGKLKQWLSPVKLEATDIRQSVLVGSWLYYLIFLNSGMVHIALVAEINLLEKYAAISNTPTLPIAAQLEPNSTPIILTSL